MEKLHMIQQVHFCLKELFENPTPTWCDLPFLSQTNQTTSHNVLEVEKKIRSHNAPLYMVVLSNIELGLDDVLEV